MRHVPLRPVPLLLSVLLVVCGASCQGGKRFYPVQGKVFADDKPAEGVLVVLHPLDDSDPQPVQPSGIVQADGSFVLRTFLVQDRVVKEGAPPGKYRVTCTWYPPDLQKYLGRENLPDKLQGRYTNPKSSELLAEVKQEATELAPFHLKVPKP